MKCVGSGVFDGTCVLPAALTDVTEAVVTSICCKDNDSEDDGEFEPAKSRPSRTHQGSTMTTSPCSSDKGRRARRLFFGVAVFSVPVLVLP